MQSCCQTGGNCSWYFRDLIIHTRPLKNSMLAGQWTLTNNVISTHNGLDCSNASSHVRSKQKSQPNWRHTPNNNSQCTISRTKNERQANDEEMCFLQNQMKQIPLRRHYTTQHIRSYERTYVVLLLLLNGWMYAATERTLKTVRAIIKPIIQSVNQTLVQPLRVYVVDILCVFCFWFIRLCI